MLLSESLGLVFTFGPTEVIVSKNKQKFRLPRQSNFLIMTSAINVQLATYSFAEDSYDGYDVVKSDALEDPGGSIQTAEDGRE